MKSSTFEFIMQELATELWPITKEKGNKDSKIFEERFQSLKHKRWTEWTNKRLAAIEESNEIKKKVENKADFTIFNLFMQCGEP